MNAPAHSPARHVAFRVDASRDIGAGHAMRCLALAQALDSAGIESTFLAARLPEELEHTFHTQGRRLVRIPDWPAGAGAPDAVADAEATLAALSGIPPVVCLVVDHYGLDAVWEKHVRAQATRILAIDDLADRRHDADWLLDQNLQTRADRYAGLVPRGCRELLGPRFALLRPEFAKLRASSAGISRRARVLLAAGAGDAGNATGRVLAAWRLVGAPRPPLDVVIGAMHPHAGEIREQCAAMADVRLHVQTDRMAELLAESRLLIGAAGTISWERCCLGVPALMFSTADNQRFNLQTLAARRTGLSLGPASALDAALLAQLITRVLARPALLERWSRRAGVLVDGLGARRLAVLIGADSIELRPATADDAAQSWQWRNHPHTRGFSRDSSEIPFEHHRAWWHKAVDDPRRRIYIARCASIDVGVLRLDIEGDSAEVSIYLDPALNGLGLGPAMLRNAQRAVQAGNPRVARLTAGIVPGNRASERAFTRVGFERDGEQWVWSKGQYRSESKVNES